ncbi:MAG TPA: hypothetical protein PKY56_00045 [Candidatus Kapabacteria bacterium]|nr:hypothetical protein [Candidatus Kapabacteria bacterium]
MEEQSKELTELYERYEYLAVIYSNRINNIGKLGFDKQDLIQELRLKIWQSLIAYKKKVTEYNKTGKFRPVPLLYYIKCGIVNKLRDYISNIEKEPHINYGDFTFDIGKESNCELDWMRKKIIVNDIDLLDGLSEREKPIFCMYLKGYTIGRIKQINKRTTDISEIIRKQITKLNVQKNELLEAKSLYVTSYLEVDE